MITEEAVWDHLRELKDPMFGEPLSVVEVGLVDKVEVDDSNVHIALVMFNRGRVYIDAAASPIRQHVLAMEGVGEVVVECRWDKEWTPDRLAPTARRALGFTEDDPVEGRMHVRASEKADVDAQPVEEKTLQRQQCCIDGVALDFASLARDKFQQWWGGWRFYRRFRLEESGGLARRGEPVHLNAVFDAGQVRDLEREIRVVEEETGKEIPCQVYGEKQEGATRRCTIVLLADIGAGEQKTYLLLHGNLSPACWPPFYATDLLSRGKEYALQVENDFYRVRLSPLMGHLRNLYFKKGGMTELGWDAPSPINIVDAANDPLSKLDIAWHGEDLCIHWNPDFRNQLRYRMTNWPEVPHYEVVEGPLYTSVRRWGYPVCPTHPARAQTAVRLEVTYNFYQGLPYFTMESRLDVEQEADVLVVRNDEWLFRQAFTHALWMMEAGPVEQRPAMGDEISFAQNPALVGFYNEDNKDVFASLRLAYDARGFPGAYHPQHLSMGTTPYGNQFWGRDVFHVGEEMAIQPGATVGEYNAYLCYSAADEGGQGQGVDWYDRLRRPLKVVV